MVTDETTVPETTEQPKRKARATAPPAVRQEESTLWPDLVAALGELPNPLESSKGNYGTYADLATYLSVVRPILAKHRLALIQPLESKDDGRLSIVTTLVHASGETMWWDFTFAPLADPQKVGGQITYYRRYSLAAALGMASEDSDGNGLNERIRRPDAAETQIGRTSADKILALFESAGLKPQVLAAEANAKRQADGRQPLPADIALWPADYAGRILEWIEARKAR
jgi:hypothetical protein